MKRRYSPPPEVGIRHVAGSGDDTNDGLTWASAFRSVAAAVQDLPIQGEHAGNYRHSGKVYVGRGKFPEVEPIEYNADLTIEGLGSGVTKIERRHDGPLLAPSVSYTDWNHHLRLIGLLLDGDKANAPVKANLLDMPKAGFNTKCEDVFFANSSGWGTNVVTGLSNLYLFNCSGAGCAEGWLRLVIPESTNLCNLGIYGFQVDDCGTPIIVDSLSSGDANVVSVNGLETEGSTVDQHDRVIEYRSSGGDNPVHFNISNVSAFRVRPKAAAVVYEAEGPGPRGRFVLSQIHGSGYVKAFSSDKTGATSTNNHSYREEFI